MKKVLSLAIVLVTAFTLAACGGNNYEGNNTNGGDTVSDNPDHEPVGTTEKDVSIKLTFNNEEVIVKMYDNPTSRDFIAQLPLTTTFEDYVKTEKISYLAKKLSTEKAPSGSESSVGDFAYYSPWGNLAIYYKDFGYATNELIILGKI